jgi:hypothetical protein
MSDFVTRDGGHQTGLRIPSSTAEYARELALRDPLLYPETDGERLTAVLDVVRRPRRLHALKLGSRRGG